MSPHDRSKHGPGFPSPSDPPPDDAQATLAYGDAQVTLAYGDASPQHPDDHVGGTIAAGGAVPFEAVPPAGQAAEGLDLAAAATLESRPGGGDEAVVATMATLVQNTVLPEVNVVDRRLRLEQRSQVRYQVIQSLAEGGVGEVLVAEDHDIGRRVALKRLRADMRNEVALVRFVEEIRTTGRLEHPNIVPIHDVGVDEQGEYYFVMKFVDGETLESVITRLRDGDPEAHAQYTFEHRVQVFVGLLEAVAFAHSQGVIHRDIKPANVMVGQYGEVLLMDWGIAKPLHQPQSGEVEELLRGSSESPQDAEPERVFETLFGTVIGTPAYMSPEQARGEPADQRSDVYALSVLLHEFLGLQHYLNQRKGIEQTLKGVQHDAAPAPSFMRNPHQPSVPMDLSWYVRKGLDKDPANRYPSVEAMIQRLQRRAEGRIPVQCHLTLIKRITHEWTRFVDKHPMLVSAALMGSIAAAVGGAVFF